MITPSVRRFRLVRDGRNFRVEPNMPDELFDLKDFGSVEFYLVKDHDAAMQEREADNAALIQLGCQCDVMRGFTCRVHEQAHPGQVLLDALAAKEALLEQARDMCAQVYQAFGSVASDAGLWDTDATNKVLDNLSMFANGEPLPHKDLLPYPCQQDGGYDKLKAHRATLQQEVGRLKGELENAKLDTTVDVQRMEQATALITTLRSTEARLRGNIGDIVDKCDEWNATFMDEGVRGDMCADIVAEFRAIADAALRESGGK